MSSRPGFLNIATALRSPSEEYFGAATHGFGLAVSIVGGIVLVIAAASRGDVLCAVGCGSYAATLVGVYAASTLSHLYFPEGPNRLFRSLDQGFIYLLIVGTFTPFALTFLRTPFWLAFYGITLAIAIAGFLSKTVFAHQVEDSSPWLYVALGWAEGIAVVSLLKLIPTAALCWVVAGGLCYTIGVVFLVLDIRRYHFHAIWHVMVMAGSACHYVPILRFVADGP